MALAILLVGLLGEREDGLAAAVLCLALVTVHLACLALSKLLYPDGAPLVSRKAKIWIGVGLYLLITIGLLIVLGNEGKNDAFQPQNEFKLDPWIEINIAGIDLSINKAVLYLALASALTIGTMSFIASRMQREPNKVQMAVEIAYDLTRNNITGGNIPDERLAKKWFPFLGTLFFFIFFSNMIGFLPLPINTRAHDRHLRARVPHVRALRGDGEPLDPARARARRLGQLPRRGHPGEGLLRLPEVVAAAGPRGHERGRARRSSS